MSSLASPRGHCSINYPRLLSHLQSLPLHWLLPGSLQIWLRLIYSRKLKKIEAFFSILPTSEVISLSLTFPRQLSFLIEFTVYLSSLFHCWCTPRTRANCLAASSIRWNSCSNDHQYPSKTQLQSLSCLACLWYFIYSYGHSLIHILHVVSTQPAMLLKSMCLPSWFLVLIRDRGYWWGWWVL